MVGTNDSDKRFALNLQLDETYRTHVSLSLSKFTYSKYMRTSPCRRIVSHQSVSVRSEEGSYIATSKQGLQPCPGRVLK